MTDGVLGTRPPGSRSLNGDNDRNSHARNLLCLESMKGSTRSARNSAPLAALLALTLLSTPAGAQRLQCGTPAPVWNGSGVGLAPSDCGFATNSPQPEYEPTFFYDIPVVFHVIQHSSGTGFLDAATIQEQIDILNEDFLALPGTPGAPGNNALLRFHLATIDPTGQPTPGITYATNDTWFQDMDTYWNVLAWDPNRYLNIYTNSNPCCFGYVSGFPSEGLAGQQLDRVVLWYEAVGRDPTPGSPLNTGRTASHEVGHYLGLYHTFNGGCSTSTACDTSGDLICDTNTQGDPTVGCPASQSSCSSPDPFRNYMDYTQESCRWEFSPEQINRMRCTIQNWRPDLPAAVGSWTDLGGGTSGVAGIPRLSVSGFQTEGNPIMARLAHAAPGALLLLRISNTSSPLPMFGGTLHSTPPDIQVPVFADVDGTFEATVRWEAGTSPGTQLGWQFLCEDGSTSYGLTLSNGVLGASP
jgi:hypothetical protein